MDYSLIIPAFIAGFFIFFAPCTLPLVPGFLAFISGVSLQHTSQQDHKRHIRAVLIKNALWYIVGFTIVFMFLGTLFGTIGQLLSAYRFYLAKLGGILIIFFGLYLTGLFHTRVFAWINTDHKYNILQKITPGTPVSSFLFGVSYACGWTPCVGPILGSILLLASTQGTAWTGTILLFVFSVGLAIPYLIIAIAFGHAMRFIKKVSPYVRFFSMVSGVFLICIGILMVTGHLGVWTASLYKLFDGIMLEKRLLPFL